MPLTAWRKSTLSNDPEGNCVEVAFAPTGAAVRDSKNTTGPTLAFSARAWRAFASAARDPR